MGRFIVHHRWPICLTLAAFVVRLHWNLVVHPLGDYVYSDMAGYDSRADRMLEHPDQPYEYAAFFPYGTQFLLAAIKFLFGKDNYAAIGVVYAMLGAALVGLVWAVAARVSKHRWVPIVSGLLFVFYYPAISLGGYMLSEAPFAVCMMAASWLVLRLVDDGRPRDGWLAGIAGALGLAFRPQLAVTWVLLAVFWLVARRHLGKLRLSCLVRVAIPMILLLSLSAVRFHHHTGRLGLISENGSLNLLFGRCHPTKIHGNLYFQPPPFLQLRNYERSHPDSWFKLKPVLGPEIRYPGYIGDSASHHRYIRQCIQRGGWLRQAEYSLTHVVLLWHYNVAWPDSSRAQWRGIARWWQKRIEWVIAVPSLLGLVAVFFPRRRPKLAIVALNHWSIVLLAAVIFGGARERSPYDGVIVVLALEVYAIVGTWSWRRIAGPILSNPAVVRSWARLARIVRGVVRRPRAEPDRPSKSSAP